MATDESGSKKRFVSKKFLADRKNVWVEFNALLRGREAVNIGQGFPDFAAPKFLLGELEKIAKDPSVHRSPPLRGVPSLLKAVCQLYSPKLGRVLTEEQVITGIGAYGVLYLAMKSLLRPGDEVIMLEPFFESYTGLIESLDAVPVFVPFTPHQSDGPGSTDEWRIDQEKLERSVSPKSKVFLLNNPNNPLGKALTREEVEVLAAFCARHGLLVVSDEVYEWIVYEGREHVRIAAVQGMFERTLTVCSVGKMFSVTGWKIGWGIGPTELISKLEPVLQGSMNCGCSALQLATGEGIRREAGLLGTSDSYYHQLSAELQEKRNRMFSVLAEVGLSPIKPSGSYFMLFRVPKLSAIAATADSPADSYDVTFCKWMIRELGLATIPVTPFCSKDSQLGDRMVRICFAKQDSTLDAAVLKIRSLKERLDSLS